MPVAAEVEGLAGDGDGGEGALFGGHDDGAFAFFAASEVNAAIGGD